MSLDNHSNLRFNTLEFNLDGSLGDEARAHTFFGWFSTTFKDKLPDVAVFPEAYKKWQTSERRRDEAETQVSKSVERLNKGLGYEVAHVLSNNDDGRPDNNALLVAFREEAFPKGVNAQTVRLAGRNAILLTMGREGAKRPARILAMHGYDRPAELQRRQIEEIDEIPGGFDAIDAIIADLNSTHRKSSLSPVAMGTRGFREAERRGRIRVEGPTGKHMRLSLGRVASLASRAADMFDGESMATLAQRGFRDADPDRQSTFPALLPMAQLDHILLAPTTLARNFVRYPRLASTNHLAIGADVTVQPPLGKPAEQYAPQFNFSRD